MVASECGTEAERHNWQDYGACITYPQHIFFPPDGDYEAAEKVCARCPVQQTCLDYALDNKIKDGMWGRTSPEKRRKMRREIRLEQIRQREQQGDESDE